MKQTTINGKICRWLSVLSLSCCLLLFSMVANAKSNSEIIYVISSITENGKAYRSFTYQSNGLVLSEQSDSESYQYTYNKKGNIKRSLRSIPDGDNEYTIITKYKYKSGVLASSSDGIQTSVYEYANGQCVRQTMTSSWSTVTNSFTYNKKGRITEMNLAGPSFQFKYDKKGFLVSEHYESADGGIHTYTFTNTYKNNLLRKQVIKDHDDYEQKYLPKRTLKFKYKKINVPSKYVSKVKAQQKRLLLGFGPLLATC